ncbi:hypothetical protein [Hyphococcus luteus]|uniref:Uncharacterized protein n=1 Tax=Hyphococcus luteus TaxID=2058213 RepID=A0A2S7K626_9PROT|nr:hypothetical protein [Marinicaulis flavus]PQA87942.1 hypothetical protein CW354_06285 [Marinicaulis flavus]
MIKSLKLRSVRTLFCASVASLALHACATGPGPVLTAEDLLSAPYAQTDGEPFDVDAMFAVLPDWVSVSHNGARFDAGLGAMVIDDLAIALASAPDARLVADRAVMWGGDPAAADAVFSGAASLEDMSALFDRLSIEGLHSQGLQWENGTENASLSIGKLVIDGLAARSYALEPKEGAAESAGVLRHMAAVMGAFAYDGAAYSDFSFRLNNNRGDNVAFMLDEAFARGYRAGAVDYESVRGVYASVEAGEAAPLVEVSGEEEKARGKNPYEKILNTPPAEAAADMIRHPAEFLTAAAGAGVTEYEIDFVETRGVDISGGLAWLAQWALPPITETELLDFGAQTMTGYRESWNGAPVYTVDRIDVAAADFYWLVPAAYDVAYEGVNYDFNVMVAQMRDGMGPGFATEAAPQFDKLIETLTALGVDRLTADMGMAWSWNGETGDTALSLYGDAEGVSAGDVGLQLGGPSLARWEAMAQADTPLPEAAKEISLKGLQHSLADKGILDRLFAYAAVENGADPEDPEAGPALRQSVAAMVRLTGAQAGEQNARIPAYAEAVAKFIESGGALSLVAAPEDPVDFASLQAASQAAPQTLPDVLNVTLTHTE